MTNDLLAEHSPSFQPDSMTSEETMEYGEVSRGELSRALDMFALARGTNISQGAEVGSLALAAGRPMPIKEGETQEELQELGWDSMKQSFAILEDIDSNEGEARANPACTVCVPVAILQEDPDAILQTIDLIRTSQANWGQPFEIVLWANAGYEKEDDAVATEQLAKERYNSLRQRLTEGATKEVQIRTALEVLPKNKLYLGALIVNEAAMSRIRSHYMDAIALEAKKYGYGFEHPVIWMDADTTFMAPNVLQKLSGSVRHFDALLVHANLQYSMDWATSQNFADLDDATKAVAINEIHRRQLGRDNPKTLSEGYIEECGLAFALGSYLRAGGINTSYLMPLEESQELAKRMLIRNFRTEIGEGVVPLTLLPHSLLSSPELWFGLKLEKYLDSVRIGTSARRHRKAVEQHGLASLTPGYKDEYDLFSDMKKEATQLRTRHISQAAMRELIELNELAIRSNLEGSPVTAAKRKREIDRLIDKYLKS